MIEIRWSRRSRYHLEDIRRYIAAHDGAAAERVRLQIVETIKMLRSLPRLGHAGSKEGTRELNVPRLPFAQHESAATPRAAGAQNALDPTGDAISSELRSSVSIWRRTACERHP
jgi:plasmid stabilization system protein ParE